MHVLLVVKYTQKFDHFTTMPELPIIDRRKRYQTDPPADKTKLERVWKLLEGYSGIPPDEIDGHIRDIVFTLLFSSHKTHDT